MHSAVFDEFVKSQQGAAYPEIDWDRRKKEWLKHLDELHGMISGYLKEYIPERIQLEDSSVELNEENIGLYQAKQIILTIGRKKVKFQPIGTFLFGGSKGRVDVIGPGATDARLVLVDGRAARPTDMARVFLERQGKSPIAPKNEFNEKLEWKIVTRPPERRFTELTQETFFQMIMEVANG